VYITGQGGLYLKAVIMRKALMCVTGCLLMVCVLLLKEEWQEIKDGVEVKKINPVFTLIVGILKYQEMCSLNCHTATALVIAR
jgi:hypothetical protein